MIEGTQPDELRYRNHGTAVIGVLSGDRNAFGVTGISSEANIRAISFIGTEGIPNTAGAIRRAADKLSEDGRVGNVILISLHRPGPRFNYQERDDQRGYIAIEWWKDDFLAIESPSARA